jgi:hypothetical protein
MSFTKYDILARTFFDIADKIQDISDSEVASTIETFVEEDYASLVATVLDAAYWILSGETEVDEDHLEQYVAMNVYTDMIYRGYDPDLAWEEAGLSDLVKKEKTSSEISRGSFIVFGNSDKYYAGLMMTHPKIFCFDGSLREISSSDQVKKISSSEAKSLLKTYGKDYIKSARSNISNGQPRHKQSRS